MKKLLLTAAAAVLCAPCLLAEGPAYGTTPETAVPFPAGGWFAPDITDIPVAYFTYTNTLDVPGLWGAGASDPNTYEEPRQIYVYLCDEGQEAFQMSPESNNSYILLPGQEYLVKITPKIPGFFCSMPPVALPESMKGKRKYYPAVISSDEFGASRTIAKGETAWYQLDVPYPTRLALTDPTTLMPVIDGINSIEAIHIECPGGTNTGDAIDMPYLKAGKNVIGISVSEDIESDALKFMFAYSAMTTLNCGNHLTRGKSMKLGEKETYPDSYYTVDRFFDVPEDGTYTFTNHGAKGTILNIGMVNVLDPDLYTYECVWDDIRSATVGNNDAQIVMELKKGDKVLVQSDAFGIIGEGMENLPYLMVEKGNTSSVASVAGEAETIKAAFANGQLSVESVLLAAGAEVSVVDMAARKVASANAPEGADRLEMSLDAAPGVYIVVVRGKGSSESAKILVK